MGVAALAAWAPPASAQLTFLQNDSYTSGSVLCYAGVGDSDSIAARFTASAGQYPYTIDRVRVFGCGGGDDTYAIAIYQDDGGVVNPGTPLWFSQLAYQLSGANTFNDVVVSGETPPPPVIASGTIRVEVLSVSLGFPIGLGADTNGIVSHRNFLRLGGVWGYSEDQSINGDWILRLGILPSGALPTLSVADVSIAEGDTGTTQAIFTVSLSSASGTTVTANFATAAGTATAGSDYVETSGVVTFNPGATVATIPVTINGDFTDEPDETFTLTLSGPAGAVIGDGTATGTILDDDGANYFTVTPCRVLDTRTTQPLATGVDRTIPVTGACGVPATAKAVSLNITVADPTAGGFVKLFPAGGAPPITSAINFSTGQTRGNNGIYGIGAGGALVGRYGPVTGTTHLILDVTGYFE
jgi:hypothetical protein